LQTSRRLPRTLHIWPACSCLPLLDQRIQAFAGRVPTECRRRPISVGGDGTVEIDPEPSRKGFDESEPVKVVAFELLPRKQWADLVAASSCSRDLRADGLADEIDQPPPEVLSPARYASGEHGRDARSRLARSSASAVASTASAASPTSGREPHQEGWPYVPSATQEVLSAMRALVRRSRDDLRTRARPPGVREDRRVEPVRWGTSGLASDLLPRCPRRPHAHARS
jgi:hypothetical protein